MYKGLTQETETFMTVHELKALEDTQHFGRTTENSLSPPKKVE
jgi:hypothetical protein